MGRKKDKFIKRTITFYKSVFKFTAPLHIITDAGFILTLMLKKRDIKEELSKSLDETINLVITTCIAREVTNLESQSPGITKYALKYKLHECNHEYSGSDCIKTTIGNRNAKKYILASQDLELRKYLRNYVPAVPLIFFDQNMILMEKPSEISLMAFDKRENLKQEPTKDEKKSLNIEKIEINKFMKEEYMKSEHFRRKLEEEKLMRLNGLKTKKALGPNPLSRLKKKKFNNKENINEGESDEKPKRVRKRNKLKRYVKRMEKRMKIEIDYNKVKDYIESKSTD